MLPWDPTGKTGPKKPLPDQVSIVEPKEEILPAGPVSEHKGGKPEQPQVPVSKQWVVVHECKDTMSWLQFCVSLTDQKVS